MISASLTAQFWQNWKFLPKASIVRSLPRPLFEQFDGGGRRPPTIRPGAAVKRGGHAPVAENGLDHAGVGTEVCQFVTESVAAAMESQTRRDLPIPLEPQDKGTKCLP